MVAITNKRDVTHVWAQQERPRGKAGSVFFEGPTIYSYGHHFPIASFTKDRDGDECVLLTTRTYSSSTANHISCTRQAVSHKTVYLVYNPRATTKEEHKANFAEMQRELRILALEFPRKRTATTKQYLIDAMRSLVERANGYSAAFRLGKKLVMDEDVSEMVEKIGKAFRAEQRRDEAKAKLLKIAADKQYQERLAKWLAGEGAYVHGGEDSPTKMRIIIRDGEQIVQTSRGASFPASHAVRAWPYIKGCRANKVSWHRNGSEIRVGEFRIDSIDEDGGVTAGCHTIAFEEIERIAGLLGLT